MGSKVMLLMSRNRLPELKFRQEIVILKNFELEIDIVLY